jgi:hypothetical protein
MLKPWLLRPTRWLVGVALALLVSVAPALAKTSGVGNPPYFERTSLHVTAFRPLARLGSDAIRVTYESSRGGDWSFELHRAGGVIRGGVAQFGRIHGRLKLFGWMWLGSQHGIYTAAVAGIDAILATPEPQPDPNADLVVCTDGAGYLVERRTKGVTRWANYATCYDSDSDDIVRVLVKFYPDLDCWLLPPDTLPDHCRRPDLPDDDQGN